MYAHTLELTFMYIHICAARLAKRMHANAHKL